MSRTSYIKPDFIATCHQNKPQWRPFEYQAEQNYLSVLQDIQGCPRKFAEVYVSEYSPAENENDQHYYKPLRVDSFIDIVPFPELSQCLPQKFPDLEN